MNEEKGINENTKKIIALVSSTVLFLIIAFYIYIAGSLNIALWVLFYLPVLMISWHFGVVGSSLMVAVIAMYALFFVYDFATVGPEYSAIEVSSFFFSAMLHIAMMFLISTLMSIKFSEFRLDREKIKKLSLVDRLTGLKNYAYFIDRLTEERERTDLKDTELSLIMMDIDYFKEFNDKFGHQKGNVVLEKVADAIKESVRTNDIVSRYGGEEFAIILPDTSTEVAFKIAERIRKKVAEIWFYGDRSHPRIRKTISGGVATYPVHAQGEYELIDKADRALYYAKESGRNNIKSYSMEIEKAWMGSVS